MNITEALTWGKNTLLSSDVSEPEASAEVLLSHVLNLKREKLISERSRTVGRLAESKYRRYIKRRQNHEPVWQIIGEVDFWGLTYAVNRNVLVPRPETELLVAAVLDHVKKEKIKHGRVLDVGTGSGTIIIALAKELPQFQMYASDLSRKALALAKKNANSLLMSHAIDFRYGSLLKPWRGERFDIICANLPYIPHEDMASLQFDVLHHEPRLALDGGSGGMVIYEEFFKTVSSHLTEQGTVFVEIGLNQGAALIDLVRRFLPNYTCEVRGDLAGIDRIAIIKKSKKNKEE